MLAALTLAVPAASAQPVVPTVTSEPPRPRTYVCQRASSAIDVDGRLDDPAWQAAAWSEPFVDIEGEGRPPPRWQTRVKLLWDSEYLYVGAWLEEPHVWATLTRRDTIIFHDNDFEVFIDPDGDTHHYYELEINALATVWDLLLLKPYRDGGPAVTEWDIDGLRAAVWVDGTLNDPSDEDGGWSVELAFPFAALSEPDGPGQVPSDGDTWRVNFSRVQWPLEVSGGRYRKRRDPGDGSPLPEANWVWSPQGAVNMHMPEMWGLVQFSHSRAGEGAADFEPERALAVRWALRRVYYAQREYREERGRYASSLSQLDLTLPAIGVGDITLTPSAGGDGYVVEAVTADGTAWRIREDGKIWSRSPE